MNSLNDFISEYFMKEKYAETLKLFEEKNGGANNGKGENSKMCDRFINYLKRKETEKENEIDELGFEINFGAFQHETKVRFVILNQIRL